MSRYTTSWVHGSVTWSGLVVEVRRDKDGVWSARLQLPTATLQSDNHLWQGEAERAVLDALGAVVRLAEQPLGW
jgi:hypothetical protein